MKYVIIPPLNLFALIRQKTYGSLSNIVILGVCEYVCFPSFKVLFLNLSRILFRLINLHKVVYL